MFLGLMNRTKVEGLLSLEVELASEGNFEVIEPGQSLVISGVNSNVLEVEVK